MGIFGNAVNLMGIISSLQYLSSGMVSIMISVGPVFTVILAHIFLEDERLTPRKVGGVIIALVGGMLLIILGESGLPEVEKVNPIGYLLVLGGLFSGSVMTIYARKHMQAYDTFNITGVRMFIGALAVMPLSLLLEGFDISRVNINGVLVLLYASMVGSFFGMMVSFYNIQKFGSTASVTTSYVIPVVTGLIGVLLLDEAITWGMIGGISLIMLGVSIINFHGRRRTTLPLQSP